MPADLPEPQSLTQNPPVWLQRPYFCSRVTGFQAKNTFFYAILWKTDIENEETSSKKLNDNNEFSGPILFHLVKYSVLYEKSVSVCMCVGVFVSLCTLNLLLASHQTNDEEDYKDAIEHRENHAK